MTGATSGIGRRRRALAGMGAPVVILARDASRADGVAGEIRAETGNDQASVLLADLASLDSVRSAADRFRATHDRLQVLVNNAGVSLNHRSVTVDGFETTFAVNHLAPFLLTNLLLGLLEQSAPRRNDVLLAGVTAGLRRLLINRRGRRPGVGVARLRAGGGTRRGRPVPCCSSTYRSARPKPTCGCARSPTR